MLLAPATRRAEVVARGCSLKSVGLIDIVYGIGCMV
jgi:hypothetical protein